MNHKKKLQSQTDDFNFSCLFTVESTLVSSLNEQKQKNRSPLKKTQTPVNLLPQHASALFRFVQANNKCLN